MRLAFFLFLSLAACGGGEEAPVAADANQIERLSAPPADLPPPDPARLLALSAEDMAVEALPCRFAAGESILVAANGSGALVRTPPGLRNLVASAPVASHGGFFEDRQLSISIGRDDGQAGAKSGPAPAHLVVTNRRSGKEHKQVGLWGCDI